MHPDRRTFIQSCSLTAAGIALSSGLLPVRLAATSKNPRPSPAQLRWQEAEIGLIYHFDLPIAARRFPSNNSLQEVLDPDLYQPEKLDTDQWLEAAKAAGARYAIFTATHFNGFMQWQSDLYPYGLKQTSWQQGKADVVKAFIESCHRADILPGLYFSTHRNAYWSVWGHYVNWGQGRGTQKQQRFNRIAEQMTKELCSRYGPLIQIWYDAGVLIPAEGGPDVLPIFERYQPDSVFYHNLDRADFRWIGNEEGYAAYPCWATMPSGKVSHRSETWKPVLAGGDPEGGVWSPGMVDVPLRGARGVHNWFWKPDEDHACHSTEALVRMYDQSVGRNCNFVVGAVVTPEGLVPQGDIDRLAEFGRAIRRRFARPLAETSGTGTVFELVLPDNQPVSQIVIMEDIQYGERIRAYNVEGQESSGEWRLLCTGQSVGHKRVQQFAAQPVQAIRLLITSSVATPQLKRIVLY